MKNGILAKLKERAERQCWCDEKDFSPHDRGNGNYDECYAGGVKDGEALLARQILAEVDPEAEEAPKQLTIFNEKQETMFDTAISTAVEDFMDGRRMVKRAKERLPALEKVLIEEMKRANVSKLTLDDATELYVDLVDPKERIKVNEPK